MERNAKLCELLTLQSSSRITEASVLQVSVHHAVLQRDPSLVWLPQHPSSSLR
jgi:hypothetical protein